MASSINRETVTQAILKGKKLAKLSFYDLTHFTGRSEVWTTAAILGQHPMTADIATKVLEFVGIGHNDEYISLMQEIPSRGHPSVLQEVVDIYGPSIKAIINETFGDGIVSPIDCEVDVKKVEDPKGGYRLVITISGRFLAYQPW